MQQYTWSNGYIVWFLAALQSSQLKNDNLNSEGMAEFQAKEPSIDLVQDS